MSSRWFPCGVPLLILVIASLLAACAGGRAPSPTPAGQQPGAAATPTVVAATPGAEEGATPTPAAGAGETPEATPEPTPVVVGTGANRVTVWHNWAGSYAETSTKLTGIGRARTMSLLSCYWCLA